MRHAETSAPGELLNQGTFYWGTLKGVGKIYVQVVIDAFCSRVRDSARTRATSPLGCGDGTRRYHGDAPGDLLCLSWGQVDDDHGIMVRAEKTGDTLLLEWSPRLRSTIDQAKQIRPKVRGMTVLCRRDGKPYTSDGFSAMWKRLMTKAVQKKGISRFTFHDLRAKCATDARLDSQALLGHRTEAQHSTYLRAKEVRRVTPL